MDLKCMCIYCQKKYWWHWLYGSWIYIYLSIQFLSPLKFRSWQFVFCTTLCNTRLSMTCSGLLVFSRNSGSSTDKPFASTWVHSRCLVGSVLLICLAFCVVLWFCVFFAFCLCLVCPMLQVSLNCLFLIAPSVFSNVYLTPWHIDESRV